VRETVSASKKLGRTEALAMTQQAQRLVAAKGKKVTVLDLTQEQPSEMVLAALLLGPTGNMRAPTLRVGQTLLIGYNEQAFAEVFG
jgi:arsenate reductase-like glutaredoxin family protein